MNLDVLARPIARLTGRKSPAHVVPPDFDDADRACWEAVRNYTMCPPAAIQAVRSAVTYLVRAELPGAIVECGVWRGGAMMAAARTLLEEGADDRDLFLFDTFEGMPAPGPEDVRHDGWSAAMHFEEGWCAASRADVERNLARTSYPADRVHLVEGLVEQTVPECAPAAIALLRLDTDWYSSTRHELEHLFPRVSSGGVIVVDDYGYWRGARRATDEYFGSEPVFLQRIDHGGRLILKG